MTKRLAEMTWPEVAAAVAAGTTTVILPLGSTEQHGPHLPLATDTLRAADMADRVAALLPNALVAPALPLGCSDEHAGFPGLLGLDADTLAAVIVDCARRMTWWGVQRVVLLSGHGGNGAALERAAQRLGDELPNLRVWLPANLLGIGTATATEAACDGITPQAVGIHAGEGETSEILFLRPDLVRRKQIEPGYIDDMEAILPLLYAAGLRPVTPNGVLGDPTCADAARGERYLRQHAAAIAADISLTLNS